MRILRTRDYAHMSRQAANTHVPNGLNPNAAQECEAYDALIRSLGGIDLQLHKDFTLVADEDDLSSVKEGGLL